MSTDARANQGAADAPRQERLVLPGDPGAAKLPLPIPPGGGGAVPPELKEAWTRYMINGFRQNEQMFQRTLDAFLKPYRLTVWLYAALFAVGIGLFLVAAVAGLQKGESVVAIAFAGLSVATFIGFFMRHPLQALEENLEFITWLGVAFNTYWTRLMYMQDPKTVQAELKAAEDDFRASVEKLIAQHAELRGKRPGAG
jgi:hypothetical protein